MSLSLHHIWSMYLDTWMRTRKNWWNTLKQNLAGVEVMLTPQCQNFRWRSVMNVGMQPRCLSQSCCYERKQWKISLQVLDICAMETIDHRADQQVSIYQQSSSHEPPIPQLAVYIIIVNMFNNVTAGTIGPGSPLIFTPLAYISNAFAHFIGYSILNLFAINFHWDNIRIARLTLRMSR